VKQLFDGIAMRFCLESAPEQDREKKLEWHYSSVLKNPVRFIMGCDPHPSVFR